jgi:hypothetical protein
MQTDLREQHFAKHSAPIALNVDSDSKRIDDNEPHPLKQASPSFSTESGMETDSREEQLRKPEEQIFRNFDSGSK